MDSKTFVLYLAITLAAGDCSLENLYKDSTRQTSVRELVAELFEQNFSAVLQESRDKAPFLVPPAVHFKSDLKKLFVEYGQPLSTYEDLDISLKSLNYLRVALFKAYREDFEDLKKNGSVTNS